ncbi:MULTISPECIES: glutamate--tRNA ligase [Fischerella]|uniref:Glutamate--tRNA ligase n=5 Tax=Fischerella TaxID=1190 RepID=G6FZM2_9CYAN|nr:MULTISPECIES: glutamate--tRNA ligase [Fischerella]PMB02443.1 glutamate--tRNA ligase [Fischerella thermalis CCMEE 5273]PMB07377.1 glutamate--tRNA ligase [Fischerella thermalis CCMEE 5328]BCX06257.1 MAG: glutamate--tRNA ligase [Fischerella sp.]EHC08657.1 glutamyl-tRNA synthetase [Fischerella thermalis JSC-11]MBF1990776.1 glutamate--tRNA ligase [Fischerella thermalis M58_A2018_009]
MTVRVRIAPSPTGNLHIGTARTAVFNWLFARHHDGKFILRIEDTDQERSRPEYTENILQGLRWLGLNWDEGPFFQTQRLEIYKQAVQSLLDQGLAYRCYTTAEELEALREAQKARGEAPRYDNRHRHLTPEQEAAYKAEGRSFVIRFKIDDDREIVWNDLVRDKMVWRGSDLGGDMVIARAAADGIGQPLYNFAVVVDDIDMQITHVIRGEDHIANTAKQILLYEAFGAKVPEFAHTPLILNQEGRKLSKRDGVTSISDFKQMGFTAEALVNYMTLLGWSPPDSTKEIFTLPEAAQQFSFERVNKAGAKFDWAKLDWLNSQYIHAMPVDKLTDLLIPYWEEAGYKLTGGREERSWLEKLVVLIQPSLTRLVDAVAMSKLFFTDAVEYSEEATVQLKQEGVASAIEAVIAALQNQQEFNEASAQDIIKQVVKQQNVKKGLIMRSLRAALTGDMHGPDLIQSWLLLHEIGLDQPRLVQATAK